MWLQEDTDLVAELQTPGGFYPLPAAPPRPALWGHWLGMGGGPPAEPCPRGGQSAARCGLQGKSPETHSTGRLRT